jgi:pSer/pThr/pTyr-binding forkhead associated (FHA) protein
VVLVPTEAPAALLHAGRRTDIGPGGATIGRAEDNEVVVSGEKVSRRHARVELREEGAYVSDLASHHGTAVNGEPLGPEPRLLP